MRRRNVVAMDLRTPKYRKRVTKHKKREASKNACRGKYKGD